MSTKSTTFDAPHIREAKRAAEVAAKVTKRVGGSFAPPPMQAPVPRKRTRIALESIPSTRTVRVSFSLAEAVAGVSAFLAAADHALVSAARWENLNDEVKAHQMYARATMLEWMAEELAKAARNSG